MPEAKAGFVWDDIKFVLAVVRSANIGLAATDLGCDKTTVSRRLAAFEEALGRPIFERNAGRNGSIKLLKDAEDILDMALDMDRGANRIMQWARGSELSGPVKVASTEGVVTHILTPLLLRQKIVPLARCLEAIPELDMSEVHLMLDTPAAKPEIRLFYLPPKASIDMREDNMVRKVGSFEVSAVLTETYVSRYGQPLCFEEMAQHRLATHGKYERMDREGSMQPWLRVVRANDRFCFQAPTLSVLTNMLLQGEVIAALPKFVWSNFPQVRPIDCDCQPMRMDLWMASPRQALRVTKVRHVWEVLLEAFEKGTWS